MFLAVVKVAADPALPVTSPLRLPIKVLAVIIPLVVISLVTAIVVPSVISILSPCCKVAIPVNCTNSKRLVPTISFDESFVQTNPSSAFIVPSCTKVYTPAALVPFAISIERLHAPVDAI